MNIAEGLQVERIRMMDCTSRSAREGTLPVFAEDIVLLAVPAYCGRVPEEIVPFMKTLKGGNKPVILTVVYGNRDYEDALLELPDICRVLRGAAGPRATPEAGRHAPTGYRQAFFEEFSSGLAFHVPTPSRNLSSRRATHHCTSDSPPPAPQGGQRRQGPLETPRPP